MHPTIRGSAVLARVAFATAFISGCTTVTPPSASPPASTTLATPQPTPPTSHVAIHWERITGLDDAAVWHGLLAAGPGGFVALENCRSGAGSDCATAWFSPDGRAWTAHPIPAVKKAAFIEIASGRGGYVISGFDGDFERRDDDIFGTPTMWLSPDGVTWERVGHVGLDACCVDVAEPLQPWTVALAPSGDIVAGYYGRSPSRGWTSSLSLTTSGPLVLDGSGDWEVVKPSAFGLDTFHLDHVFSTPSELLLFGGPCRNCPEGAWSSTDGRGWTQVADLTIPTEDVDSVVSDGRHTVAALKPCLLWRYPTCGSQIWTADDGGGWSVRLDLPDAYSLNVVSTGSAFVAIGTSPDGFVQLGSLDGSTWTEVDSSLPTCASNLFAAHNGVMVAGWYDSCGWWRGTIEVVPGTRTPLPTPGPTPTPPPTLDPSAAFEASVTMDESCRYNNRYVRASFAIAWSGDVAIDFVSVEIDGGQAGGLGSTPEKSGGFTTGHFLTPGEHIIEVEFEADLGEPFSGPIVRTIEETFDINSTEPCD